MRSGCGGVGFKLSDTGSLGPVLAQPYVLITLFGLYAGVGRGGGHPASLPRLPPSLPALISSRNSSSSTVSW